MKRNIVNKLLIKTLISILLFILYLILNKSSSRFSLMFYEKIYNNNISFAKINYWYESHFGNILPIKSIDEIQVFNESLIYEDKEKYHDGVLLKVTNNYIVPAIRGGIVIFIGDKDIYGKTIIVEDENGLDIWYSNININNIHIYDYVNKGEYLGEAIDNNLIIVFQKKGEYLDYNKYI